MSELTSLLKKLSRWPARCCEPQASLKPSERWTGVLLGLIVVFAAFFRYSAFAPHAFYGDDLAFYSSYVAGACGTTLRTILFSACDERFRPLAFGFITLNMHFFGTNLLGYFIVNCLLQGFVGWAIFRLFLLLSRGRAVLSFFGAVAIALSRFAFYEITQVIGPIESLATLFSVLSLTVFLKSYLEFGGRRNQIFAIVFFALAALSHERFLALAPWFIGAVLILDRAYGQNWWTSFRRCSAYATVPIVYVGYKTLILKSAFLIGTGGTQMHIEISRMIDFAKEALGMLIGLNGGPAYLVGFPLSWGDRGSTIVALLCAGAWGTGVVSGVVLGVRRARSQKSIGIKPAVRALVWPFLLLGASAIALAPGLTTIRLETRWVFVPLIFFFSPLYWAAGEVRDRELKRWRVGLAILTLVAFGAMTVSDARVVPYLGNTSLVASARIADGVKNEISDRAREFTGITRLVVVADPNNCKWALFDGRFFAIYGPSGLTVDCAQSVDIALAGGDLEGTRFLVQEPGGVLRDVTREVRQAWESQYGENVAYSFDKLFSHGKISSERMVATPTGRGVFLASWPTILGPRRALTVLSGFSYAFDNVDVPKRAEIRFKVGMIFQAHQRARATVTIESMDSSVSQRFSRLLVQPKISGYPDFDYVKIQLNKKFSGKTIRVIFAAESPGGDATAQWVAYADPRLISGP